MIEIVLAGPRGPCAGVERAVTMLDDAIEICGLPLYVLHEIVHNKYTLDYFREKGVQFVENIHDIPDGSVAMLSAHGVSQSTEDIAKQKNLKTIDATCHLVRKVHLEAIQLERTGYNIILIGHAKHPEVIGTAGRITKPIHIVQNTQEAEEVVLDPTEKIGYITQTTLSIDETKDIVDILKRKYPHIKGQNLKDICYATQNRQRAVKSMIDQVDMLIVIGAANSSNSNRLREIGELHNKPSFLINDYKDFKDEWLTQYKTIGITAGASAPEILVTTLVQYIKDRTPTTVRESIYTKENIKFKMPDIQKMLSIAK